MTEDYDVVLDTLQKRGKMKEIGREAEATRERCIEDWCVIHWAIETSVPL